MREHHSRASGSCQQKNGNTGGEIPGFPHFALSRRYGRTHDFSLIHHARHGNQVIDALIKCLQRVRNSAFEWI